MSNQNSRQPTKFFLLVSLFVIAVSTLAVYSQDIQNSDVQRQLSDKKLSYFSEQCNLADRFLKEYCGF